MIKNRTLIAISLTLITSWSCSRNKLTEISLNCACEATEHYITSTDEVVNNTKKFTFTNSRLFALGVSKDGFANSFAMQICNYIDTEDNVDLIEINIVKEKGGNIKSSESYEYDLVSVRKNLPKYLEVESVITDFVVNIYNKNYSNCLNSVAFRDVDDFKSIIDNVYTGLNKGYRDTRIVEYKTNGKEYLIFGIIKSEDDKLDLFKMKLIDSENVLKIISFNF